MTSGVHLRCYIIEIFKMQVSPESLTQQAIMNEAQEDSSNMRHIHILRKSFYSDMLIYRNKEM